MDLTQAIPINLNANYLLASLIWSAVGGGFWIYGKKQRTAPPLVGGIALIVVSWAIESAFWMSLTAIGIIFGIWLWSRNSD